MHSFLENGQSLHDVLPPDQRNLQLEATARDGEGWKVPPIPAEVFNVNSGDREWVDRQCTMQPLATFQQDIKLTGKASAIKNITFILATGFADSPFTQFYEPAKAKGWKTLTIPCGHDVMLDLPEKLTQVLEEIANPALRAASL
ncbi:MAG: hypothetical protein JWO19_3651 [Bryobacterales bacterium]|jgi:hypothetical protein|nr:hypothetical protein [Bryobacterales bacterium]